MTRSTAAIAGHKGLRGQVLLEVKKSQPITAKALAAVFGVSANGIRRHLKELEIEGLVRFGREQHGLGAPAFAYRLSEAGEALFPNGYRETLTELLAQVEEREGRQAVLELFERRYQRMAEQVRAEAAGAPRRRRLEIVARVLSECGYMAEWRHSAGEFHLAEHNCAMRAVIDRFPEVCRLEQSFLDDVLGASVERRRHIASGCNSCEYLVHFAGQASQ